MFFVGDRELAGLVERLVFPVQHVPSLTIVSLLQQLYLKGFRPHSVR
jgi:hypothetical protein